ncbi:MAG: ArsR/SmtB family transcription factor [Caulobacteraceae bacterium]
MSGPAISQIAALLGNPARANMMIALLDGRALGATELAYAAGVSPQTTSGHLAGLSRARLLTRQKQGRCVHYRLASPLVGRMVEGIMAVAADGPSQRRPAWRGEEALRNARTCYDHLAGRLGVALAEALMSRRRIVLGEDGGRVTPTGIAFFGQFGLDLGAIARGRRAFCRPCLDWSERRAHLAGALGAALAARCFELGWIERMPGGRALAIPPAGRDGFAKAFGMETEGL